MEMVPVDIHNLPIASFEIKVKNKIYTSRAIVALS